MAYGNGEYQYEQIDQKVNIPQGLAFFGSHILRVFISHFKSKVSYGF